jgi:hypothetical protein
MKHLISTEVTKDKVLPDGGVEYERRYMTLLINGQPYGGKTIYERDGLRWTEWALCRNMALRLNNFPEEAARFGQPAEVVRQALLNRAASLEYNQ